LKSKELKTHLWSQIDLSGEVVVVVGHLELLIARDRGERKGGSKEGRRGDVERRSIGVSSALGFASKVDIYIEVGGCREGMR